MTCSECGTPMDFGVLVCPNCGASTRGAADKPVSRAHVPGSPLAPPQVNSTAAVISLSAGIISWFAAPCLGGIVAIVSGHMARKEIRLSQGRLGGEGLARAGLILGYLHLALLCLGIPLALAFFGSFGALLSRIVGGLH